MSGCAPGTLRASLDTGWGVFIKFRKLCSIMPHAKKVADRILMMFLNKGLKPFSCLSDPSQANTGGEEQAERSILEFHDFGCQGFASASSTGPHNAHLLRPRRQSTNAGGKIPLTVRY